MSTLPWSPCTVLRLISTFHILLTTLDHTASSAVLRKNSYLMIISWRKSSIDVRHHAHPLGVVRAEKHVVFWIREVENLSGVHATSSKLFLFHGLIGLTGDACDSSIWRQRALDFGWDVRSLSADSTRDIQFFEIDLASWNWVFHGHINSNIAPKSVSTSAMLSMELDQIIKYFLSFQIIMDKRPLCCIDDLLALF